MRRHIAIAGAGMAGLAAAALLARDGHRVTLFDKSPAPAPVGSGLILQPVGLAVLHALGADKAVRQAGQRIERLYGIVQPAGRTVLDVRYGPPGSGKHGIAIHRASLFEALLAAAREAGVEITHAVEIDDCTPSPEGRGVSLLCSDRQREGPFDLVIDALGVRSPLVPDGGRDLAYGALWASLDRPAGAPFEAHALEQRYRRASQMAGVLPIGRLPGETAGPDKLAFFWSLKQADYPAWRTAPLDSWKDEVRALWPETAPLLAQISHHDDLVMARYRHRTMGAPVRGRIVHLGDAAHAASPQLGQGANMALLDAYALAHALRTQPETDAALGEYARLRWLHVRLYQAISLIFTPFYQSDSAGLALLRDHVLSPVSRFAPMRRILSAMVAGELAMPLSSLRLR